MYIKALDMESPMMQGFEVIKNLFLLNVYTLMCCIPVVTAGAAITALHYSVLRMVRDEDSYITKNYFESFKANLKQGTGMTVIMLCLTAILAADIYAISLFGGDIPWFVTFAKVLVGIILIVVAVTMTWYFPVAGKFEATIKQNLMNSFKLSMAKFPRTLLMIVINALPWVLTYFFPALSPVLLVFGVSVPAYFCAKIYDKVFKGIEKNFSVDTVEEPEEINDSESSDSTGDK